MARGAAWMVLSRLVDRSVGIVSTLLLARLLVPADFGLVAMALSVIAIIELATAFSFEIALIQKDDPQRAHYDTAWTLNILIALGGACLTAALAHPTATFYGEPRLPPVMYCIAAGWLIAGFENIGTVNFRRSMDFWSEFRLMAAKRIITFTVTIGAAILFRSYWALVVGTVAGRIVGVVLSYAMQPYRPRFALVHARELFSFSGWLLVNNMAGVVLGRLPHFVVGRVFGAQTLGAYTIGSEIAQLAHTELVAPINRAMFPGYARLVNDLDNFRRVCTDATGAILLVVLPASFGIAIFAEPIVRVLLGVQWRDAAPVIQVLAFAGAVSAVTSNNVAAYLALGRPQLTTLILIARLVLFVTMIALLPLAGRPIMVAWAELVAALASLLVSLPILCRALRLRARDYFASAWRPLLASVATAATVHTLLRIGGPDLALADAAAELLLGLPCAAVLYLGALWLLWRVAGSPPSIEAAIGRRALDAVARTFASLRDRMS
jgi:O-antigen/teichoic acid export membrane protein